MVQGSEKPLGAIVEAFYGETDALMPTIPQALEQGDSTLLTRSAHTVKSSCASLGAESARAAAAELEQPGKNNDLDAAQEVAAKLEAEIKTLMAALESEWPRSG